MLVYDINDGITSVYRKKAQECMEKFFNNKEYFCGGPIPKHKLYNKRMYDLVIHTDSETGIDFFYSILEKNKKEDGNIHLYNRIIKTKEKGVSGEIRFYLSLLKECASLKIDKLFRGGIILLYLSLCEGAADFTDMELDETEDYLEMGKGMESINNEDFEEDKY